MKKEKTPLLIAIIVLAGMLSPSFVHIAHAATGEVCLADPSTANPSSPCPSSPPVFSAPQGQQIRIGVFIIGSDPMDGFDITLLTSQPFLVPAYVSSNTVDLTNTVLLGTPIIVGLCVNGQLVTGTTCNLADKTGTIHFAATSALGSPLTSSPTTGLLFTAIFNVTGTSTGSQPVVFQSGSPGCTATSIPGLCVTIANGTAAPLAETAQTATFDNSKSATMPSVALSANVTSLGPEFPGVSNHVNITATPINGYSINSTNPVHFSTIATTGLSPNLSPSSCSTADVLCSSLLTLQALAYGNYSITVLGSYLTFDSSGNPDTVSSVVNVFVDVYDFGFTISPTTVTFVSGEISSSTATLSSQNGFTGPVSLSTSVNLPAGLTVGYVPSQVSLSPGQTLSSTITFTASPSTATTYHVKVSTSFGSRVKTSALLTVTATAPVPDFYFFAIPTTIGPVNAGVNETSTITVGFVNGFSSPVTLSVSSPMGVIASLNQTTLTGTHNITLTASSNSGGTHTIIVTGSGGGITHSIAINLIIANAGFILSANPDSIITGPHVTGTSTITVAPIAGFVGEVTLATTNNANPLIGLVCSLSSSLINTMGTSTLACNSPSAGNFPITVIGTSGSLVQTLSVTFIVTSGDFALSASPSVVNTDLGVPGTSTITVTAIGVFNDTVILTSQAAPGLACSLTRGLINVTGTSVLSCTGAVGSYTVTVTGISGALVHSVSLLFSIRPASAVALVCIAYQGSNSCPNAPPVIGSSTANPSQLRVAVVVDSSPGLSGFDITLLTNNTLLKPAGVDLAGTVLVGQPLVLAECLSGLLIEGSTCSHTDTNGTLHLVATSALGTPLTTSPTTGLLFTAIYNVTGTTSGTTIGFQTGCSSVSVAGGVCVTIANGTPTPVVENIQTGIFTNLPTFLLQTPFPVAPIVVAPGSSGFVLLNVTGLNGFTGTVTLTGIVSPSGPTVTISPANLQLNSTSPFGIANATVRVASSVPQGSYTLNITGTNAALSRSLVFLLIVTGPDFSITLGSQTIAFDVGQSGHTTISVSSLSGFSGTIALTATTSPSGLSLSSLPSLSLSSSGTNSSTIVIGTNNSTRAGTYMVAITGASGALSHLVTLTVNVEDFRVGVLSAPTATLQPGSAAVFDVFVESLNGFSGPVILNASQSSAVTAVIGFFNGGTLQENVSIILGPDQSFSLILKTTASISARPGNYTVTLTATGPSATHTTNVVVTVVIPPPDFTITANPVFLTILQGNRANSTVTIQSVFGFQGNLTLSYQIGPSPGITITLQPSNVVLDANTSRTAILTISTSTTAVPTTYMLTVTAANQTASHAVLLSFRVLTPPDESPVANFTFTPPTPAVNTDVSFNGTSSIDPDGFVTQWMWNFGDGSGLYFTFNGLIDHTFNNSGNYTVTLTVYDNSGQNGIARETVTVIPQPAHDVSILQISVSPTLAVSTQTVDIQVLLRDDGTSAENVTLTTYVSGHAISTLSGFIFPCGQGCFFYTIIIWDTTGFVPGNYTISATLSLPAGETDPTPQDNSFTDGIVTILPPPAIVSVPNMGTIGSKITIQGSGFPNPTLNIFGPQFDIIQVTFDDMNVGFVLTSNGTFTFVMDVPEAQPGMHVIKAYDEVTGARTLTSFQVLSNPGNIVVTVDTGAIYFPGDTATVYVLTTLNGARVGPGGVQLLLMLIYPNGSITNLRPTSVSPGFYEATYKVPSSGSLGTYSIVATAHVTGAFDGSTLSGFEVKPTWLSGHGSTVASGTAIAGLLGFAGLAWRKGYFRKKNDNEPPRLEDHRGAEN